jgi:hypothetical protein
LLIIVRDALLELLGRINLALRNPKEVEFDVHYGRPCVVVWVVGSTISPTQTSLVKYGNDVARVLLRWRGLSWLGM